MSHFQDTFVFSLLVLAELVGNMKADPLLQENDEYYATQISMQLLSVFEDGYHKGRKIQNYFQMALDDKEILESISDYKKLIPKDAVPELLDRDLRQHYQYLSTLGSARSSFTELFTALYVKHLAALYSVTFLDCVIYAAYMANAYYTWLPSDSDVSSCLMETLKSRFNFTAHEKNLETSCLKVANHFAWFAIVNNDKIVQGINKLIGEQHPGERNYVADGRIEEVTSAIKKIHGFVTTKCDPDYRANYVSEIKRLFLSDYTTEEEEFFYNMHRQREDHIGKAKETLKSYFAMLIHGDSRNVDGTTQFSDSSFEQNKELWKLGDMLNIKLQNTDPDTAIVEVNGNQRSIAYRSNVAKLIREIEIKKLEILKITLDANAADALQNGIKSIHVFIQRSQLDFFNYYFAQDLSKSSENELRSGWWGSQNFETIKKIFKKGVFMNGSIDDRSSAEPLNTRSRRTLQRYSRFKDDGN